VRFSFGAEFCLNLRRVDSQESEDSRIIFQTSDTSFDGDGSAGQSETVASPPTSPVRLKGTTQAGKTGSRFDLLKFSS
jgi:hypothetical protein